MIKFFLFLNLLYSSCSLTAAENTNNKTCFLLVEKNKKRISEGDCTERHPPCSTFKIAISLIGFNEGVLIDENLPALPFKEEYTDFLDNWRQTHTPLLWIKNSCVWYSQVIMKMIGKTKFKQYMAAFNYGNQDISGDKGKENGLTNAWLSSSLQISAEEQVQFIQNLITDTLPVNLESHRLTRNILYISDLADGWKLYGKTGSGCKCEENGDLNNDRQLGWFVGWIQKDDRAIMFAHYIEDDESQATSAGLRAKTDAINRLANLINAHYFS